MKIHIPAERHLQLSDFDADGFDITSANPALYLSALSMFVASLGRCTFAVLAVFGDRHDIDPDDISMEMRWEFAENPTRFSKIVMDIHWPGLPDKRLKVAQRMAQHCTIHNTIHECVEIVTEVDNH